LREEFIYLAVIMDVFTRIMRGWRLGLGLGVELTLGALELALSKSTPEIHHSDQGLQYAATDYTARLQSVGAQISMAEVGQSAPQRLCRASHPNDQGRRSLPERLSRSGGCAGADTRPRL